MPEFGFTAPSIQPQVTGVMDRLQAQAGRYRQEDFLGGILDSVNKAARGASEKVGKISDISNVLSFLNILAGKAIPGYQPFSPGVEALIGTGETYFSDKAMKHGEKGISEQASRGYLSSELGDYLERFQQGGKDMFRGNILDTLLKTGLSAYSAYKGGAYGSPFEKAADVPAPTTPTGYASLEGSEFSDLLEGLQGQVSSTPSRLASPNPASVLSTADSASLVSLLKGMPTEKDVLGQFGVGAQIPGLPGFDEYTRAGLRGKGITSLSNTPWAGAGMKQRITHNPYSSLGIGG